MKLKIRGSDVSGLKPKATDVDARELVINTADGRMYSSSNGQDIVELGVVDSVAAFSQTKTYNKGNIVTDGDRLYIAKLNIPSGLAFDPSDWHLVSSGVTYSGTFIPKSGAEYPTSPKTNSSYMVQGLTAPYVFTSGDLNSQTVKNGDSMIWNGTKWITQPAPVHSGERGGIKHDPSGVSYLAGDIVTDFGDIYICKSSHVSNGPCDGDTLHWKKFTASSGGSGYTPKDYEFHSDGTGLQYGAPRGGHTVFKVDTGNTAHEAVVWVGGFKLPKSKIDNTVDGQITLIEAVKDNTLVEISV